MTDSTAKLTTALADRYRLERELGAGGMATVYLAHDVRHDRKVALKVLRPELAAIIGAERFLKEIKVTANLQHPHILGLIDSGEVNGLLYYVMPFVDGESLRDRLTRETQLPVDDAVRIAREVAGALDYAHRHHVIHRDIKPENVLLHEGQALVADFGIALAASKAGGTRMTETGMSLGTPHYMSPEQAMGEREITAKSDVYALGAVLYEMLVGEPPFTGPTAQAIVAKVVTETARPLLPQRRTVPPHVEAAVLRALEKLPADRFATAAAFAEALTNATTPATGTSRAAVSARGPAHVRPWRRIAIGAAALAVLFAALAAAAWLRPRAQAPVARFNVLLRQFELSIGSAALSISPDGTRLVYSERDGAMVQRDLDRFDVTPIPGAEHGWTPAFSPDGERLAFNTGFPGAIRIVALAGGAAVTLVADSTYGLGAAWSDDGWLYYIASDSGRLGLKRIRPDGGTAQVVAMPDPARDELFFVWPHVLPGGRTALITIRRPGGQSDIAALDIATGATAVLASGLRALYATSGHLLIVQGDGSIAAARFDPARPALAARPTPVVDGVSFSPSGDVPVALSRNGTLLYQTGTPVHQVVRLDRVGSARPVDGDWTGQFTHVALSPDGARLAISVQHEGRVELWVKMLDRGPLTRLASGGTYVYRPSWTPDGRSLLFVSDVSGRPELYRVSADGSGTPVLLRQGQRSVDEGSTSRDGRWLIYRAGSGGGRDVFGIRPGVDSVPLPLATSEFEEYSPVLSPDGRWIAYGSDESRRSEVYVRPFPDAPSARWQVSREGGSEPVWAHSGRELFYRNGAGDLVAATVASGPPFRVTAERVLFSARDYVSDNKHRTYAVSPDDRTFIFVRPQAGDMSQVVVVLNWLEELRAKVRGP